MTNTAAMERAQAKKTLRDICARDLNTILTISQDFSDEDLELINARIQRHADQGGRDYRLMLLLRDYVRAVVLGSFELQLQLAESPAALTPHEELTLRETEIRPVAEAAGEIEPEEPEPDDPSTPARRHRSSADQVLARRQAMREYVRQNGPQRSASLAAEFNLNRQVAAKEAQSAGLMNLGSWWWGLPGQVVPTTEDGRFIEGPDPYPEDNGKAKPESGLDQRVAELVDRYGLVKPAFGAAELNVAPRLVHEALEAGPYVRTDRGYRKRTEEDDARDTDLARRRRMGHALTREELDDLA